MSRYNWWKYRKGEKALYIERVGREFEAEEYEYLPCGGRKMLNQGVKIHGTSIRDVLSQVETQYSRNDLQMVGR